MTLAADLPHTDSNARASIDSFHREQRFLLTPDQAAAFSAAVAPFTVVDAWDPARPISYARTTYFDDDQLSYFRSADGGVLKRLRVREYALASRPGEVPVYTDTCFLELKQHADENRRKLRLQGSRRLIQALVNGRGTLPPTEDEPLLAGGLAANGSMFALNAIRGELAHQRVTARIGTWYRRVCLRDVDGHVRITMDEELMFLWPRPLGTAGAPAIPTDEIIAKGPARVLETKLSGDAPSWLLAATADLQPASAFSKYHFGMQVLQQAAMNVDEAAQPRVAASPPERRDGRTPPPLFLVDRSA